MESIFANRWMQICIIILAIVISQRQSISEENIVLNENILMNKYQKLRADQIISIFENETPIIQYEYVENLKDGRGLTAGRAGFTTANGDLLIVVERYAKLNPESRMKGYIPRLRETAKEESDSLDGLEGLEDTWKEEAQEASFRQAQDEVSNELYYQPALDWCRKLAIKSPLGITILYDTGIQHGIGSDPDGLPSLIKQTIKKMNGSPQQGVNEEEWLHTFLEVRLAALQNASDPETRQVWRESTGRVDVLTTLLNQRKWNLEGSLWINPFGKGFQLE